LQGGDGCLATQCSFMEWHNQYGKSSTQTSRQTAGLGGY